MGCHRTPCNLKETAIPKGWRQRACRVSKLPFPIEEGDKTAIVARRCPQQSSRPVKEKDAAGSVCDPEEQERLGTNVKMEQHCTHMEKEPGGADTRRRSAACT